MEEQLIIFETAKLAKEKGFDFPNKASQNDYQGEYPTQSLLQKWLREVHNIDVYSSWGNYSKNIVWYYNISKIGVQSALSSLQEYGTYEQALEKGLVEALKQINYDNINKTSE